MVNRKILVLGALVVLLGLVALVYVGERSNEKASQIMSTSLDETLWVESYNYHMVVAGYTRGYFGVDYLDVKTTLEGDGLVDFNEKFMHTPVKITSRGSVGSRQIRSESELDMYVINQTLYSKAGDMWITQTLNEQVWSKTQLDNQVNLVEGAKVKYMGIEVVNGVETYVLDVKPDIGKLTEYTAEVSGDTQSINTDSTEESLKDYTITEWVSTESYLPVKTLNKMVIESGNVTTVLNVLVEYTGYNQEYTNELPIEAYNATGY